MILSVSTGRMGRMKTKKDMGYIFSIRHQANIVRWLYVYGSTLRIRGRLATG